MPAFEKEGGEMTVQSPERWIEDLRQVTDSDPELSSHGRYYSCSLLLDMEERRYLVRVHRGKVEEVVLDPQPLEQYEFAISASPETWRKFCQEVPPAMYHGLWSTSFRRDMRLTGDLLVLMQNLRCVTRHMELLRQIGAPV
jgi:hypothetical protein